MKVVNTHPGTSLDRALEEMLDHLHTYIHTYIHTIHTFTNQPDTIDIRLDLYDTADRSIPTYLPTYLPSYPPTYLAIQVIRGIDDVGRVA